MMVEWPILLLLLLLLLIMLVRCYMSRTTIMWGKAARRQVDVVVAVSVAVVTLMQRVLIRNVAQRIIPGNSFIGIGFPRLWRDEILLLQIHHVGCRRQRRCRLSIRLWRRHHLRQFDRRRRQIWDIIHPVKIRQFFGHFAAEPHVAV